MVAAQYLLLASDTAFFVTFGIFVVALLVLVAITVRWAIRHDRAGFQVWRQRQQAGAAPTTTTTTPPPPQITPEEGEVPPPPAP